MNGLGNPPLTMGEIKSGTPDPVAPPGAVDTPRPQFGKIRLDIWNSVLPLEKLTPTPSQKDGLSEDLEIQIRSLGCELIQLAGKLLRLPQVAMATGCVLFQRFYYAKSLIRLPFDIVAMACLTLASKIEEAPRRIRDTINVFHHIKQVRSGKTIHPMVLDQNYIALKNQVIKAERRVLKELGFCVHVKHPHKIIVMYLKWLELSENRELIQMSWNFMNDSLRTDVFVRYLPETIAVACIYLAARKLKEPLPKNPSWFDVLGVEEDDIKDCCYRMICLYNRKKPNQEELEGLVDKLRRKMEESRRLAKSEQSANPSLMHTPNPSSPASRTASPSQNHLGIKVLGLSENGSKSNSNSYHEGSRSKKKKHRRSRSRSHSYDDGRRERKKSKKKRRSSLSPDSPSAKKHKRGRHREKYRSRSKDRDYYPAPGARGGVCSTSDNFMAGKYRGSNGHRDRDYHRR